MTILQVNGRTQSLDIDPATPVLWALRDTLNMTGTKFSCGAAVCGACTVHADGQPIRSCITPVSSVEGRAITTVEAITSGDDRVGNAVRDAWIKHDVAQCGYCQSGQIMVGNICRCGTYERIRAAVADAARALG
jgi:isoquinoline 1-oxidoreductase subunit alpha